MEFQQSYGDLCREIEILELRLDDLEQDLKRARKICFSGQLPSDPLPVHVPLDKALEEYDIVVAKIIEATSQLEVKRLVKSKMENNLNKFEGLEYQVAYMRDIQGLPLYKIAEQLGYSYDWIRKVSSRIKAQRRHKKIDFS
ncbi:hypothetical protein D3C76_128160 [compost metagenome]